MHESPPFLTEPLAPTTPRGAPIACTLAADDYERRAIWLATLARDALQRYERRDLVLELRYSREAAERVREMVRAEGECCAFLAIALEEGPEDIRLVITVPEGARAGATMLFEQFTGTAQPRR